MNENYHYSLSNIHIIIARWCKLLQTYKVFFLIVDKLRHLILASCEFFLVVCELTNNKPDRKQRSWLTLDSKE